MPLPYQPWRAALQPASFRGIGFHVEVGGQAGGRRNVTHEFPLRDVPWTEDMGRSARRWPITGYVIGPTYLVGRDALIAALEAGGVGTLIHPTLGSKQVNANPFNVTESRERGGICTFTMDFVEAGSPSGSSVTTDTQGAATTAGANLGSAATSQLDTTMQGSLASGTIST